MNEVDFTVEDAIAIITINRPQVLNALNQNVIDSIRQRLIELKSNDQIEIVIFTGEGTKAFAAGADIEELNKSNVLDILNSNFHDLFNEINSYPKVTIAAINGYALGGGCELALACDIRIASQQAKLGLPELSLGIIPGAGGTQRLIEHIGLGNALYFTLTGEMIDAKRALEMNLVSKIVDENVLEDAKKIAKSILKNGPTAIKLAKQLIKAKSIQQSTNTLLLEKYAQAILFSTKEKEEGTKAFLEKRKPIYRKIGEGFENDI